MEYLVIKALHIVAVIVWISGMIGLAKAVADNRKDAAVGSAERSNSIALARSWDARVTVPAMLTTWLLGLALALKGGWFPANWLLIKLVVVFALSALHGVLSGHMRRLSQDGDYKAMSGSSYLPAAIVAGTLVIVTLVVLKPI